MSTIEGCPYPQRDYTLHRLKNDTVHLMFHYGSADSHTLTARVDLKIQNHHLIRTGTIFRNLFHSYYAIKYQWRTNLLQRCGILVSIEKADKSYCDFERSNSLPITQSWINVIFAVIKSTTLCAEADKFDEFLYDNHTVSLNTVILFLQTYPTKSFKFTVEYCEGYAS